MTAEIGNTLADFLLNADHDDRASILVYLKTPSQVEQIQQVMIHIVGDQGGLTLFQNLLEMDLTVLQIKQLALLESVLRLELNMNVLDSVEEDYFPGGHAEERMQEFLSQRFPDTYQSMQGEGEKPIGFEELDEDS